MIKQALLVLALALSSACAEDFEAIRAPARIVVTDSEIGAEEYALIEQAAKEWNEARAGTIRSVTRGSLPEQGVYECDVIYISRMHISTECDSLISSGCTRADGCNAYVLVSRMRTDEHYPLGRWLTMVKHEIGHALLGPEHSDVPGSIMSNGLVTWKEPEITPEEASRVRGSE